MTPKTIFTDGITLFVLVGLALLAWPRPTGAWTTLVMKSNSNLGVSPAGDVVGRTETSAIAQRGAPANQDHPSDSAPRTRGEWIRTGVGLATLVPFAWTIGVDGAAAASGGGSTPVVTVLGAGGKTGRECVEYLAARGTGLCVHRPSSNLSHACKSKHYRDAVTWCRRCQSDIVRRC